MGPKKSLRIDDLIEIVRNGGTVKTGIDIFNENDTLILEKNYTVSNPDILLRIKKSGTLEIPISSANAGGLWDRDGNQILPGPQKQKSKEPKAAKKETELGRKIKNINELKKEASLKYNKAKQAIKRVIDDIKRTGGEFDYELVETTVIDLFNFIANNDNAFSYITKEIFSYDDYLYNHSINVCTISTAVMTRFNKKFGSEVNNSPENVFGKPHESGNNDSGVNMKKYKLKELHDISLGFFLHDVGKVLIPENILNKKEELTKQEFQLIKTHSFEKGIMVLEKNRLKTPFIRYVVQYHHSALFNAEENCYPADKPYNEIPAYVKICKLADIYDAMTSKRTYKEALNPVVVVTEIFKKYANKDNFLQFILHAFVKTVGIYPPGSIVYLRNGQAAYILDSEGPLIVPFTDIYGTTLRGEPDPIDLGNKGETEELNIDRDRPIKAPADFVEVLPPYLKEAFP